MGHLKIRYTLKLAVKDVSVMELMNSEQRKQNIKSLLRRGDLKAIAEKLEMSYSYLSQAFSSASTFNFTSELARKVEHAMGWHESCLDVSNMPIQKPRSGGLHMLALRGRAAKLASFFPERRVLLDQKVQVGNVEKILDIIIYNPDNSTFLVAEQSDDYVNPNNIEQLILMMAISGAQYGVIFSADSGVGEAIDGTAFNYGDCRSRWFQAKDGKVVEIARGPKGIFEELGI